jgi:hypothetical protein
MPIRHALVSLAAASTSCLCAISASHAASSPADEPAAKARAKADAFLAARKRGDYAAMAKLASEGRPAGDALSLRQVTQVEQSRARIDGAPASSRFIKAIAQPLGAWTFVYLTGFSKGGDAEEQVLAERRGGVPAVSGYTSVPCESASCASGDGGGRANAN